MTLHGICARKREEIVIGMICFGCFITKTVTYIRGECLREGPILRCGLDSFPYQAVTTWLPSNMQVIKVWSRLLACTKTSPFYLVERPRAASV